jgi:hypothetical protein
LRITFNVSTIYRIPEFSEFLIRFEQSHSPNVLSNTRFRSKPFEYKEFSSVVAIVIVETFHWFGHVEQT